VLKGLRKASHKPLDRPVFKTVLCYPLDKRIREKLNQRLRGLEYRQQAREQQRAVRQKAYRMASMMREQGTLRGARKYLEIKGIPFRESVDPATGNRELTIPEQITLSYDPQGKFLRSRPPALSVSG
jgi:hypothetical protein